MRKLFLWIVFLIVSLLISFSCSNGNHNITWEQEVDSTVKYWNGRHMILPDSIESLVNKLKFPTSSNENVNSLKVVSYIDGNCGTCLLNLQFWEGFIHEVLLKTSNCEFLIFVNAEDKNDFASAAIKYGFTYPWLFDKESSFIKMNKIWDKRFQTALLNSKNEVILIGDPTNNIKLAELYMDTILKLSN